MTRGRVVPTVRHMERAEAVARLPATYAAVIEMLDEDASHEAIAARLGVEGAVVEPLITIARAKLARLLEANGTGGEAE